MKIAIITYPVPNNLLAFLSEYKTEYLIAVDAAVSFVFAKGIHMDLAVGDFDSLIETHLLEGLNTIRLNTNKNETDTEYAILEALKMRPEEIYLFGGVGGERIEHTYANLNLVKRYKKIRLITDNSTIKSYEKGHYEIKHTGFVSIFANQESIINLNGFKYDMERFLLIPNDVIGISNELETKGFIDVIKGDILVIETKKI